MAIEIERKFLVTEACKRELPFKSFHHFVIQGYLSFEPVVRVQLITFNPNSDTPAKGKIAVKGPGTLSRSEFEYDVPWEDAEAMMEMAKGRVAKFRYKFSVGNHIWEVDQFTADHEGLFVAEVELSHAEEIFEKPFWLGKEVTEDPRYANANISIFGIPTEKEE